MAVNNDYELMEQNSHAPLNNFLLKVTEVCNLNCSYCFMFNLRDFAFLKKPKIMPLEVVEAVARQAREAAEAQGLTSVCFEFHGGEPLLAGQKWMEAAIAIVESELKDTCTIRYALQTNGVRLNKAWVDLFNRHKIGVGVSLDGVKEVHDKYRVDHQGRGSYDSVVAGLKCLIENQDGTMGGALCVIDPEQDGLEIYENFRRLGVKNFDFLWPLDHNWDHPPNRASEDSTPYADFLIPVFDRWWQEEDAEVSVRFFQQILINLVGGKGGLDGIGGEPVSIVSIDTDGSVEPVDSLKACGDGFTNLGIDITRDPLSSVYEKRLFKEQLMSYDGLSDACKECPYVSVCGAGYLPHRYSSSNRFNNPSVYCQDLFKLISHISRACAQRVMASDAESQSCLNA